ncbi:hypothetical protein KG086_13480 [Lacticaseibacillus chiayiensis]|uniref:Virulence-associated E family protein n=2 Tax=Lactobacillaceae TaxID=33958 RepID=A0ABY6H7Q6_9LACO|nr:virulence-associated E family protein [Lacticaseibacillus chiayiensis]QVI34747.1 hypothetical protein KG086_13480 [Lacticaseibacillus chiayiensis]UYN56499.1 virulence-associated E family protein [Lacticaseibacillus chiayiensis]
MANTPLDDLKQAQKSNIIADERFQGWKSRLSRTDAGAVRYNYQNIKLIFDNDPNLAKLMAFDAFAGMEVMTKKPVWNRPNVSSEKTRIPFTDDDEVQVRNYIRETYGMTGDNTKLFADVIKGKALEQVFNPVISHLNECRKHWDGKQRINSLLQRYLGVSDTPLMSLAFKTMMVGAVARAYHPGTKFDYMAILTGSQGIGKSSLLAKLGGPWYTDAMQGYNSKDDIQVTLGYWIIEDSELSAMKSSKIDQVKRFITRTIDRLRLPYGRRVSDYERRFVLWGTTNQATFLHDRTGGRRFLVFQCDSQKRTANVMQDLTQREVDQVWGEAVAEYQSGFKLHLPDNMEREMEHVRTEYQSTDQAAEAIMEYLDVLLPVEWPKLSNLDRRFYIQAVLENANTELVGVNQRTKVTVKEIQSELFKHDLRDATDRRYAREATQIRDIMRNLDDWEYRSSLKINGRVLSGFTRKR